MYILTYRFFLCCAGSVLYRSNSGKRVLDDAEYAAPTFQHKPDHTDQEIYLL